ncbi:hypothetical protein WJX72_006979 [[Myrmecia] bisecta]|uniref:Uncharacterized protein n=1 Tax=[Myrmecia] bisecta TaxID=41462 RepID=A0AAW1R7V5_9CHLO
MVQNTVYCRLVFAVLPRESGGASAGQPPCATDATQEDAEVLREERHERYAAQAMTALLLADIHAPDRKPMVTLTDLADMHVFFWMDGLTVMYRAVPDAGTAWALTAAMLQCQEAGIARAQWMPAFPPCVQQIAQRRELDVPKLGTWRHRSAQAAEHAVGKAASVVNRDAKRSSDEPVRAAIVLEQTLKRRKLDLSMLGMGGPTSAQLGAFLGCG